METRKGKIGIGALAALAFVVVLTTSLTIAGATTVKVDPATQDVMPGDAFSVDIVVENVTGMSAFQGVVNFDQNIMQATDIIEGAFLKTAGPTVNVTNISVPGEATFSSALTTPGTSKSGSGILATINFIAKPTAAPGSYPLELTQILLLTPTTPIPTPILIDEQLNGTVNITAPPEPTAVPGVSTVGLLALIGLLAIVLSLSALSKRKKV